LILSGNTFGSRPAATALDPSNKNARSIVEELTSGAGKAK
jgi:hypothetical protein